MFKSLLVAISLTLILSSTTQAEVPTSADKIIPIELEASAPSSKVRTIFGKEIESSSLTKGKKSLIIFYRGGWCPYCNVHLAKLVSIKDELEKLDVQILAVSPDLPKNLEKSLNENKVNYTLLSDSKMNLAKGFGVAFKLDDKTVTLYKDKYNIDIEADSGEKHHLLPVPSAFLIDESGKVKFRYWNADYKTRIETDKLVEAAKTK